MDIFTRKATLIILSLVYFNCLYGANYTVTNTNDNGAGSLRDAINQANTGTGNTISFNIPGGGPYTISLSSALPVITKPMTIDGNTQPGVTAGAPKIVITNATWEALKLDAGSNGSTIRGLVLSGNNGCGIQVMNSSNHIIEGNYIGTDATGNATGKGNALHGIQVVNGTNITIGGTTAAQRNVIVGSTGANQSGISVENNSNVKIIGNYIGIGANGTTAISNALNGVHIQSGSSATIGGSTAGERNVISGQSNGSGIYLTGAAANGVFITGNYIGTNAAGTAAVPNAHNGVTVEGTPGVTIGGLTAGTENVISGNTQSGVSIRAGSDNSKVQGNIIGLDKTGTTLLSNKENGVHGADALSLVIQNNVITGNKQAGVSLTKNNNTVLKGNIIGLKSDGVSTIANGTDPWGGPATGNGNAGIYSEATTGLIIGGINPGDANVISGNTFWGIGLQQGSTGANITGNFIGTDKNGATAKGNNWDGVFANSSGSATIQGNVISGNNGRGIFLENNSGNSTIKSNLVGTNATGISGIGNGQAGIRLVDSDNTTVGGTNPTDKNVISANKYSGIEISSTNNLTIYGNNIGTDITGTVAIGNLDAGIAIFDNDKANDNGNQNVKIGGLLAGQGNIIANSTNGNNGGIFESTKAKNGTVGQGVYIKDPNSKSISIQGNSIFCNADRGIDLNGPVSNNAIKAPIVDPKSTRNTFFGTAVANQKIDIYTGDNCYSCGDIKKRQQGKTYVTTVTADGSGKWTYTGGNSINLVATATDASGNTSEFSVAPVPNPNTAPGQTCGNKPYTITGASVNGNPSWETSGDGTFDNSTIIGPVYTPGTNDKSAPSVTLTLTDSAFCNAASKTMTLTINKADIALFSIADYCVGATSTPAKDPTASGGSFSLKSLTGSGTATMVNSNTGTVSGGAADDTYEVTYTTFGACPAIGKDTLKVIPGGTVNFTVADYCVGGSSPAPVFTTPPPTPGTYTLSPATATIDNNGIITGGVSGTTYTITYTFTAGCNATGNTTVKVKPKPTVSVPPATICSGQSATLTATSTGTTFQWSPSTGLSAVTGSSVVASPTASEVYKIVATTNNCSDSTTVTVTVNQTPIVDVASSTVFICSGSFVSLTAGGDAATYTWTGGTLNEVQGSSVTVSPTSNTTYKLKGTSNGCSDSTTLTVKVNPLPNPTISPANSAICIGGQATLAVGSTFASYAWTTSPNDPSISSTTTQSITASPVDNTVYTVTVTDDNGCTKSSSAVVNVHATPVVYVSPDRTICFGDTVKLIASGATTYSWAPADGSLDATTGATVIAKPATTRTYTVTGTTTGCAGSPTADVTITVNQLPNVTATASPNPICKGASTTLTASGATTYQWNADASLSGTTGGTVTGLPAGTTTYIVLGDLNGCKDTGTVTVVVNQPPVINALNQTICAGASATLSATGAGTGTYSWSPATGLSATSGSTVTAKPASTETYTITGTDANSCSATHLVTVTVNLLPQVTAGNISMCAGGSKVITATGAGTGGNYTWSPTGGLSASTGASVTANLTATTVYTIYASDVNNCKDTTTVTATVNDNPVVTVRDTFMCAGSSVSIKANSPTATSFSWSPATAPSTGATVTASPANTTTYTITATDANNCSKTAPLKVTVNPLPNLISSGTTLCIGDSATLTISGANVYDWSPSSGLSTSSGASVMAKPTVTTTYTITGTNSATSCKNSASVTVTILPQVVPDAGPDITICPHESATLTATGGTSYLWNNGETKAQIAVSPTLTTEYTVVVSNGVCSGSDTVKVFLKNENWNGVFIPNAFTPNGDDKNDVFMVKSEGVIEFQGMIFNRWGELYYEWNVVEDGWDGKYKGTLVQEDVYIYKIKSKGECNKKDDRIGTVTVVR